MASMDSKITYHAMGYGSHYIYTHVMDRFERDEVDRSPQIAVINGGLNDKTGGVTTPQFIEAWTAVLDMCEAAGIIPVVWSIGPDERKDTTVSRELDTWNTLLEALVATYTGGIFIDVRAGGWGKFRAGGDVGNLWDWADAYYRDGFHQNEAGDTAVAVMTYNAIESLL